MKVEWWDENFMFQQINCEAPNANLKKVLLGLPITKSVESNFSAVFNYVHKVMQLTSKHCSYLISKTASPIFLMNAGCVWNVYKFEEL